MNKDYVGIKVNKNTPIAKIYSTIKKYREISISELKKDIENHDYLIKGEYTSRLDIKTIIACYNELMNIDIAAELFELDGEATTIDFFENLNKTYDEISVELDSDDDN